LRLFCHCQSSKIESAISNQNCLSEGDDGIPGIQVICAIDGNRSSHDFSPDTLVFARFGFG